MEGVEPPKPVRLKNYVVELPAEQAEPGRRPVQPARPRGFARAKTSCRPASSRPSTMVKAALEEMGGVAQFIKRGDVVVVKPNVAFDKNPDLARNHPARHGLGRRQALPEGRRPQGDRGRQPDQQPRELLLQDQGRRRRAAGRGRADDAPAQLLRGPLRRRRDDQEHLEDVLPPLPRGHEGHRRLAREGPQPLQGHGHA